MSTRNVLSPIKEEDEYDIKDELAAVPPNDSILKESKGLLEDADEPELIWLKDTKHKNLFMAKVGLSFAGYFAIWVLTCLLITTDEKKARFYYWVYKLYISKWLYLTYAIAIRLTFAFGSAHIRGFSKIMYGLDMLIGFVLIIALYFYFSLFLKTQYIYHGHYLILLSYCMFFNSIAFTLSCLIKDRKNIYNYYAGLIMMEVSTVATLFIASFFFDIPTLTKTKYRICFFVITLINVYIVSNAYFILKNRGKKFYDYEYISCYFCFWTDWLYCYWKDATRGYRTRKAEIADKIRQEKKDKRDAEIARRSGAGGANGVKNAIVESEIGIMESKDEEINNRGIGDRRISG